MATRPVLASMRASKRSAALVARACGSAAGITWCMVEFMGLAELPPAPSVAFQKFIGARRSFAPGGVAFEPRGARLFPGVQKWLHGLPAGFDAVGALKQNVVADHAVIDQRLVTGARLGLEVILVPK